MAAVADAIAALRRGEMVVLCGSHAQPGEVIEAELVLAAEFTDDAAINAMARDARGLVSLVLPEVRCDALGLRPMVAGESRAGKRFAVSVDARDGITTGVSAADRAHTVRLALGPLARSAHFVEGGHLFPVMARAGGVLEHAGLTEAALDLTRLAGAIPAAVTCALLADDGSMLLGRALERYAARHRHALVDVRDVVAYRRAHDPLKCGGTTRVLTRFGCFTATSYRLPGDTAEQVALVKGEVRGRADVLVAFQRGARCRSPIHPLACGCREASSAAMDAIASAGRGVLLLPGDGSRAAAGELARRILRELEVTSVRILDADGLDRGRRRDVDPDAAAERLPMAA